jgi:hypothetical protein
MSESYKKGWKRTFVTKLYYNRRHEVRQIPDSPRKLLAFGNLMNTALFNSLKYEEDLHAQIREIKISLSFEGVSLKVFY